MNLDKALSIYTDLLNSNEDIAIDYFKENLNIGDFKEFLDLIEIINSVKSLKNTNEFDKLFSKINDYKEDIYNTPQAANFRMSKDMNEDRILDELDKIFEEEFGDE